METYQICIVSTVHASSRMLRSPSVTTSINIPDYRDDSQDYRNLVKTHNNQRARNEKNSGGKAHSRRSSATAYRTGS